MLELQVKEMQSKKESKKNYYVVNLIQTFKSGKTYKYNKELIFITKKEYDEFLNNKDLFTLEVKELTSKKTNKTYYIANITRKFEKSGKIHRYNKEMIFIKEYDYTEYKNAKDLEKLL